MDTDGGAGSGIVPHRDAAGRVAHLAPDVLDAMGRAVVVLSPDREVLYLNPAAEDLYGWPAEEAAGLVAPDILVRGDLVEQADAAMAALRRDGRWSAELDVRRRDGSEVPVTTTVTVLRDGAGEIVALVGVSADISERRAAERALQASERRLAALLEHSSDVVALVAADGRVEHASPPFRAFLGYAADDVPDHLDDLVHPEDVSGVREAIAAAMATGAERAFEFRCRTGWGGWRVFDAVGRGMRGDEGVHGVVVTTRDVTDDRRAERARHAADERLRAVLAHSPVALFAVDAAGVVRMAEGEATRANGVDLAALLDRDARDAFARQPELVDAIGRALAGHPSSARSELGGRVWDTELRPVPAADGSAAGAIGVSVDVTERVEAERELTRLALHDPLTGLPNRALALDRLHQALSRRGRRGVAVLFIDVDELKRVNDALGHAAGDALLRVHADRLRAMVRGGDTVARFAGDEFLVVAQDLASDEEAAELADRVLAGIAVPVDLAGVEVVPSVSIGIAVAPEEPAGPAVADDLLRDADAAMYQAKRAGRGRARMFDPSLRVDVLTRLRTEEELRAAVAHQRFTVHYQPVHDLRSGAVAAVEALVRWRHPERGLLVPAQFLEVAEGAGLSAQIGDVVLRDACRRARSWIDAGHAVRVAVNLSEQQLRDPETDRWVGAILDAAGLDPAALVVEVTEAATVVGADAAVTVLEQLRAMGVGLSLDGFGTGSSSLTRLRALPVDELKIDRSFVAGLAAGGDGVGGAAESDAAIAAAVVDMAHALGLRVVAEGIERPEQLAALTAMGCDLGQGHLLGRPVAPDVLLARLGGGPGSSAGRRR